MRIIIGLILCLIYSIQSNAQKINVTLVVTKENKETVLNVTAQVLNVIDSSILFSKILKQNTSFVLNANDNYLVRITAIGITPIFKKIKPGTTDTTFTFLASSITKNLDAVIIKSTKPLVKQEDDKTIVDAEVIANSSSNAYEVLEKTPGLILDQDGNVYLNGSTPAIIYVNGREVKLSPQDLTTLLKSLPANSISKLEILRSPSAKYDAASSGGIVNIVLKKGIKLGTNGSVDASYFQGVYATKTIGISINKSDNKLNSYFTYNLTNRESLFSLTSNRFNTQTNVLFKQDAYTKFKAATNYASGGLDYKVNEKWNINYDVRFTANNSSNNVTNDIDIFKLNTNLLLGKNVSLVNNIDPTIFIGNTISAKYKIDTLGSEWTNSFEYTYFNLTNTQSYDNLNILPARNTLFGDGDISNKKNIFVLKSDAVFKTKSKYTIEVGAKYNFSLSNNNALFFTDTSTGKFLNTFQTNKFKFTENIAAGYVQVSKTFKGITVKPGLRIEYTDIRGNQLIPSDTTFKINSINLFPYIYLRSSIGKLFGFTLTGNLIFRRSITRPFYESLNPSPRYADQYTYDIGNPNLQPQFTNNYEFNVTANEFPVFSIGVNDIKNIFTTLTYQKDNILYRTYDNLGANKELYLRFVAGIPPGGKYFFYAGTQMNRINYNGIYNGDPFTYKRASWNIFMFHNYKVTPTFNVNLNAWMRVNGVFNFFETGTFGTINLSANKSILKKKMNIIISVNDLLLTNRVDFNVDVPKFAGNGFQYGDTRKFGIALKYNFGLKPKQEPKQGFEIPKDLN